MKRVLVVFCLALVFINLGFAENLKDVMSHYNPDMSKGLIFVSKTEMTLTLADSQGNVVKIYPMACGKNIGHKQLKGDMRTPEGVFSLQMIQDASTWGHDFKDGNGYIRGAYGPWFLRLKTPGFSGIGIHGTHAPESIGTRATEGCIRLENHDIDDLHNRVTLGMTVIIGPEPGKAMSEVKTASKAKPTAKTNTASNNAAEKNKAAGKADITQKGNAAGNMATSASGKAGAKTGTISKEAEPVVPQEPDSIIQYIRPSWNWPPVEEQAVKVKNPTKKQQ